MADLRKDDRFNHPTLLIGYGVRSGLTVIIQTRAGHFGVLGVHTSTLQMFSQNYVNFIQSIANLIGLAIDRWRVEQVVRDFSTPVPPISAPLNSGTCCSPPSRRLASAGSS